ncbi:hypothetical protein HT747_04150 [Brevibacillus borstelensis]|uniref:hypothetical protein n=1 Tax=Brevibacillus borstelensis TaxID=45462 RepID=UPI001562C7AB|nr:hypothetical protein [Brevibacillus borstelensis]MBE5394353.1 hypothetical protein [Brevibacillus borstelensis]MCM3594055.1 hypothetical protein [Brevibacillus borstelensis]MCM3625634.1 hypothetical protein [Brevibacillus borstelensis]
MKKGWREKSFSGPNHIELDQRGDKLPLLLVQPGSLSPLWDFITMKSIFFTIPIIGYSIQVLPYAAFPDFLFLTEYPIVIYVLILL